MAPGIAHTPGGRRRTREAHIPAQCPSPGEEARVPGPHEHARRPRRAQEPPRQGPRPAVGLIQRIRGRRAFERLSRDGKRIRRPALWCSWCPDSSSTTTSVAFALGRALGPAVTRNQLRRRLRALLREADANRELPAGMLLLGAKPPATELTFEALRLEFRSMLPALTGAPTSSGTTPTCTPATSPPSAAASRP